MQTYSSSIESEATNPAPRVNHPVVAIGASAGGLEALQELFGNLPCELGASFVVVQHLSPDYRSMLDELISRHTTMPVQVVDDGTRLDADHIYIIPPAHNLVCEGDRLRLRSQPERGSGRLNLAIDMFFISLAKVAADQAIAVVLSGTGSDGAVGLTEISEAGGIVMVQDPATAKFDGMPVSAIQTGLADVIGSPVQLAARIAEQLRHPVRRDGIAIDGNDETSAVLSLIIDMLRTEFDVDFAEYKPATLLRRVARRLPLTGTPSLQEYVDRLGTDPSELRTLLDDLLIGVTSFFRDPESWAALHDGVIQKWAETPVAEELRAWVCACSTGEEAYSLAMLAAEAFDVPIGLPPPVRIFATDISKSALQIAATATYPHSIAQSISTDRLERFFERYDDHYRVRSEIRRTVVFAPHDVTRQTPFSRMNLVTCRNMLIYMQPSMQKRVLSLLHYALRPGGALFLGSAEGLLDLADLFRPIDSKARIFVSTQQSPGLLRTELRGPSSAIDILPTRAKRDNHRAMQETMLDAAITAFLKREHASGLLVSRSDQLIRVLGESPDFLRIPVGMATNDVRELLPRNLSLSVATALHRARSSNEHVWIRHVHDGKGLGRQTVDVSVMPLSALRPDIEVDLVTFTSAEPLASSEDAEPFDVDELSQRRLQTLERELEQSRENLQATIEELETTNEEQQATNEELLASNEELQSTNEELHSVNEELHTVNADYQQKIAQLVDLNSALDGLLNALDVGIVFLSNDGRVLKFNAVATQVFRLTSVDVGRPLLHLSDTMRDPDDRKSLAQAVGTQQPLRRLVVCTTGTWRMNVTPLSSTDGDGRKILTLFDVSDLEQARVDLSLQNAQLRTLARELPEVLWVIGADGQLEFISEGYEELWGRTADWALAHQEDWSTAVHPDDRERVTAAMAAGLRADGFDLKYRIIRPDGSIRLVRGRGFLVTGEDGQHLCTIGTTHDISRETLDAEAAASLAQRFEQTILALGDVVYDRSLVDETISWRGDLFEAFGYRGNTIGDDQQSWLDRVHPSDLDIVKETFARLSETDCRVDMRYRFRRADGRFAWVRDRGYATVEHGRVVRVVGVIEVLRLDDHDLAGTNFDEILQALNAPRWRWCTTSEQWSFDDQIPAWVGGPDPEGRIREAVRTYVHHKIGDSRLMELEVASDAPTPAANGTRRILLFSRTHRNDHDEVIVDGWALPIPTAVDDIGVWRRHAAVLDALTNGVSVLSPDGSVLWANRSAKTLHTLDLPAEPSVGAQPPAIANPGGPQGSERVVEHPTLGARVISERRHVLGDGTVVAIDTDITEQREAERVLQRRASVDALTGLFLRNRFLEALSFQAGKASRNGAPGFAVVFMDLDGFKEVNDSYDHFVGNELLKAFANRLRTLFRPGDTVARFGGDEFAVLVEDVDDYRDGLAVARRIHEANYLPLTVGDRQFTISASIGVAVWDPSRHSPEGLLRDADVAMYEAKRDAKGNTVVFDAEMHARVLLRHETKRDLHAAIGRGEFELFLQPMVLAEGAPMGFEALLRWRHPRRGLLTPGLFLELASEAAELLDLESWVLNEVLRLVDAHPEVFNEVHRTTLSVNATPDLLRSEAFSKWVDRIKDEKYNLKVDFIVEIIEETMLDADPSVRLAVERAREAGIRIAVDDFGTGYSSLSYLIHWPVDVIKLDGTFAQRGTRDLRGDMVVCALVELARSLGITTVLEGVESEEQLEFARSVRVDAVQGYHLGTPQPVADAVRAFVTPRAAQA